MIRFGPAGWSYKDWAGIVYPDPKPRGFDPLAYLADFFDTIEINSTFYRPASAETAVEWVHRIEGNPDFRFTAKLWRRFTHQRGQAWSRAEVTEAKAGFLPLRNAGRLGAVLLQFPWSFRNNPDNRDWLDDVTRAFGELPLVVEVRHASWTKPGFFADLADRGVGFVNIDQPQFRDSVGPASARTSPVGYIRVHGRNYRDWWRSSAAPHERYDYLYSAEELRPWARRAKEIQQDEETEEVYVVANNHYKGKAPANALMLESMVTRRKVVAPPPLVEHYRDLLQPFIKGASKTAPAKPSQRKDGDQRSRRRRPVSSNDAGSSSGSR